MSCIREDKTKVIIIGCKHIRTAKIATYILLLVKALASNLKKRFERRTHVGVRLYILVCLESTTLFAIFIGV